MKELKLIIYLVAALIVLPIPLFLGLRSLYGFLSNASILPENSLVFIVLGLIFTLLFVLGAILFIIGFIKYLHYKFFSKIESQEIKLAKIISSRRLIIWGVFFWVLAIAMMIVKAQFEVPLGIIN